MNSVIAKIIMSDKTPFITPVNGLTIATMKNCDDPLRTPEFMVVTEGLTNNSNANGIVQVDFYVGDLAKKSAAEIVANQDPVRTVSIIEENDMKATDLKVEEIAAVETAPVAATVELSGLEKMKTSLGNISSTTAVIVGAVIGAGMGVTKQILTEEGFNFAGGLKVSSMTLAGASGAMIGHAATGGAGGAVMGAVAFSGVIAGIDIGVTYAINEAYKTGDDMVEALVANGDIEAIEADEPATF